MTDTLMTCAECDELFLDYFERQLGAGDQRSMDSHVSSCARCQGLVRDIEGIRRDADSLPDLAPSRDLWKGIESRIQPTVRSIAQAPGSSLPRVWMAAAAAALVVVSSSVTYFATSGRDIPSGSTAVTDTPVRIAGATVEAEPRAQSESQPPAEAGETVSAARPSTASRVAAPVRSSTGSGAELASAGNAARPTESEMAIAGEIIRLQALVQKRSVDLAPETLRVVEENLAIIDAAVRQARAAVERDPGSGFLSERLEKALHKKVQLLRTVALLPAST